MHSTGLRTSNVSPAQTNVIYVSDRSLTQTTFNKTLVFIGVLLAFLLTFGTPLHAQTFAPIPALSFTKPFAGANPLPQTLAVVSTSTNFDFRVASSTATGGDWLVVTGCGSYCNTPQAITIAVNATTTLAVGTYTGQVVLTEYYGSTAITIPVTLTIAPANGVFLDNLPGQVSFTLGVNGEGPPAQTLSIRNGGTGALNWNLITSTSTGLGWLHVSATSGTTPSTVSVSISKENLPNQAIIAGTFIGQLLFQTATGNITVPVSVVVNNTAFRQTNAISFVKQFADPNPLPQTLTIASTQTDFDFRVASWTARGGNWLAVTGCGSYCNTPQALTVTINPDVTLSPGTYTGQIVLTEYYSAMSITVPVNLTIAPTGGTFLDNVPGQVSFTLNVNGATPPNQGIEIRNGGTGTLNWILSKSTSDGGNWLNVSAGNGTAPSIVTVGIVKDNLPDMGLVVGTFTGQLVFTSASGTITVPVSVVVNNTAFKQVNAISFSKIFAGANPLPQTLAISSTGSNFDFRVSSWTARGGDWLAVTGCGSYCDTPQTLTATVNPSAALAPGTYTGEIVLTEYYSSMSITVPVTFTVAPADGAIFDGLPGQLSFTLKTGTGTIASKTLAIRNGGSGTLSWSLSTSTSDGGNWLNVSAQNGVGNSQVTVGIVVSALPNAGLVAGTFSGQVVLRAAATATSPSSSVTIPVSVVVGESIFAQMGSLNFSKGVGASNPLPQTLNITSTGTNFDFRTTWSTSSGGDWLSVTGCGSYCDTPQTITATVNASPALPAGVYTGQIVFTEYYSSMSITVPVTLTVGTPVQPPVTGYLVWQSDATRQVSVWRMSGAGGNSFLSDAWLAANGAQGWSIVSYADLNADGNRDLIWQNDVTRQVVIWYLGGAGGTTFLSDAWLASNGAPGWKIVALADFNGDGKKDLVWQNDSTRQVSVWYLGGSAGNTFLGDAWLAPNGAPGWRVAGAADFNGDNKPDLVWQNDMTRQVSLWYMGGAGGSTRLGDAWLAANGPAGWKVVGVAPFGTSDTKPDLVWQSDSTRQVSIWYMGGAGGTTFLGDAWLASSGPSGWTAIGR